MCHSEFTKLDGLEGRGREREGEGGGGRGREGEGGGGYNSALEAFTHEH